MKLDRYLLVLLLVGNFKINAATILPPKDPFVGTPEITSGDSAYTDKSSKLSSEIYGALTIGEPGCKAEGDALPGSIKGFWAAAKAYSDGEGKRDGVLTTKINGIKEQVAKIKSGKIDKELQVKAVQLQIDMIQASIDTLKAEGGRIPLREAFIKSIEEAIKANKADDQSMKDTYKNTFLNGGLAPSLDVADSACERKAMVEECHYGESNDICTTVEKLMPVEGCKEAQQSISKLISGPSVKYWDLYQKPEMPSKSLNEEMQDLEKAILTVIDDTEATDPNYDWQTPMKKGIEAMIKLRKKVGVKCPLDKKIKEENMSGVKSFLSAMGSGEGQIQGSGWSEADLVIGQSGNRSSYFSKIQSLVSGLVALDQAKVKILEDQLAKEKKFLADYKAALGLSSSSCGENPAPELFKDQMYDCTNNPESCFGPKVEAARAWKSCKDDEKVGLNKEALLAACGEKPNPDPSMTPTNDPLWTQLASWDHCHQQAVLEPFKQKALSLVTPYVKNLPGYTGEVGPLQLGKATGNGGLQDPSLFYAKIIDPVTHEIRYVPITATGPQGPGCRDPKGCK